MNRQPSVKSEVFKSNNSDHILITDNNGNENTALEVAFD